MLLILENDNNHATIFYDTNGLPREVLDRGLLVDNLPVEEKAYGKRAVLKVDVLNSNLWYDYVDDGTDLQDVKNNKIEELKVLCNQTIDEGFISTVNNHKYRTNRDDQINMLGQKDELRDDPTITTVMWKTEDLGYIQHTREDWLSIHQEGVNHKKNQLFKYDNLAKQVLLASSIDEINNIRW